MNWLTKGFKSIGGVFARRSNPESRSLSLRQGTAEHEYFIARAELDRDGNLRHGITHLAELLRYDPACTEWLELLEGYLGRAGSDPEDLLSEEEPPYFAVEAVRAYIYARSDRLQDAVRLLGAVVEAKPDVPYMDVWGIGWLSRPGSFESLSRETAASVLAGALTRFPEFRYLTSQRHQYLLDYVQMAKRFDQCFWRDSMSEMMHTGLLRKAGCFDEALIKARATMESNPGWHAATATGLVLREMGLIAEAESAFRRALDFDPDISALLEIADMHLGVTDWARAQQCYEEVLAREPRHDWAYPSVLFCQWKMSSEDAYLKSMLELASADSPNHRAIFLAGHLRPYTGYLPEPADATANALRQLLNRASQIRAWRVM